MSKFLSFFKAEKYFIACIDHIFLIHSSVDGYLGCFHVFSCYEHKCANISLRPYFHFFCFQFFSILKSGIAASYGKPIFDFSLRDFALWHLQSPRKSFSITPPDISRKTRLIFFPLILELCPAPTGGSMHGACPRPRSASRAWGWGWHPNPALWLDDFEEPVLARGSQFISLHFQFHLEEKNFLNISWEDDFYLRNERCSHLGIEESGTSWHAGWGGC